MESEPDTSAKTFAMAVFPAIFGPQTKIVSFGTVIFASSRSLEMNSQALIEPIFKKLNQLVQSMIDFLNMNPHAAWHHVLFQFNILIAKYDAALRELQAPALRQLIVHPNNLVEEDPEMRIQYQPNLGLSSSSCSFANKAASRN